MQLPCCTLHCRRLARLKGDLRAAQGQLDRSMARDVRRALSAVKQITEEHNIQ